MSHAEVFERLCRIEASLDLLRHRVDGWCVWPLVRKLVALELSGTRPQKARGATARLGFAVRDLLALHRLRHREVLAKTAVSLLMEREGDKYKNVLLDDVLLAVGDYLKLDWINSPNFAARREEALVPGMLSSSLFEMSAAALARVVPVPGARSAAAKLARELKAGAGIEIAAETIERVIRSFCWHKRVFRLVLRRVRPRVVVISTVGEQPLCAAAREEGIPVVEFQHGIMDRFNAGSSWTSYAAAYRGVMPLPARRFLFGEYWREELESGGFWGDELRVVGSVRMDEYNALRAGRPERSGSRIVWTTQGIDVEPSISFMAEFMKLVSDQDFKLHVKLHPLYDLDRAPYRAAFGADPRVTIDGADDGQSTFAALVDADLHVSIYSASHYDAIGLGVPTVVLPFKNHDVVSALVARGHAALARTPERLAELWRGRVELSPHDAVREYYFRSGALQTARDELMHVSRGR